jgi:hypothetical protein
VTSNCTHEQGNSAFIQTITHKKAFHRTQLFSFISDQASDIVSISLPQKGSIHVIQKHERLIPSVPKYKPF